MYNRSRRTRPPFNFGGGTGNPPAPDVLILLGVLFFTFSLQFFASTQPLVALLRLTSAVWATGFVWQLATYPLMGYGPPSLWFLLELLILFWFSRDVHRYLGQRRFWQLLAWACMSAALVAVAVDFVGSLSGGDGLTAFSLMQGQRILLAVIIAAFATLYGNATIMLFFVLPVQAKWFIGLEILFAFMGFLSTKDLAGFLAICTAVALTYSMLTGGGLRRVLRTAWLRARHKVYEGRLRRHRRRRGLRGIDGGRGGNGDVRRGPWVN